MDGNYIYFDQNRLDHINPGPTSHMAWRHFDGVNAVFLDGHVEWTKKVERKRYNQ